MGILSKVANSGRYVVEELERAVNGEPEARSVDRFPGLSTQYSQRASYGSVDKHFPDRERIQRYWELYREIPIIRHPIRSFASEVVAPGYYIETENEDLKEELEKWLSECSIVDGEIDKDFGMLLKKGQIQREVKGTSLCEKVYTDKGELYGFKLMKPETVRAFTKPGQNVLLPPDFDTDKVEEDDGLLADLASSRNFYETPDGDIAAYVQLDDAITGMDDGYYIPFTRDDIIKLVRDPDVGDVFGESRILAVEDRLNSLLKKLDDNDKAIESLAYPLQLFKFGSEEDPWEPSEIQNFMSQHSQSQFEPGMKQGVQGDLSVETVSGEVAEINESLQFDINWILAEMPMPKYALGGFESEVNQFVSRSQSARLEKQIEEAREEIENEWTPVIKDKAEEFGYGPEEVEALRIGEDPTELGIVSEKKKQIAEDDVDEGNIPESNNSDENNVGPSGENFSRPPASTEDRDGGEDVLDTDD